MDAYKQKESITSEIQFTRDGIYTDEIIITCNKKITSTTARQIIRALYPNCLDIEIDEIKEFK